MGDTYTHGHHDSVLQSHRWRTAANSAPHLLEHLGPGLRLLDVGCGPGTITVDLAERVAPGLAVGLDRAPAAIAGARTAAGGTTGTAVFEIGDVYHLAHLEGGFDVVHAHQVLQHLTDPVTALREMRRVLRPGGLLAVRDSDYGGFTWAPADPRLDRWLELYHQVTRRNRAEADAGRHLRRWVTDAGFGELTVTASAWAFGDPERCAWWGSLWADRVERSAFAEQALAYGLSTPDELAEIAAAWRRWSVAPDATMLLPHGEVLARR